MDIRQEHTHVYKICMVYPGLFPALGGAETLTYELAKSLADENEVFVVCLSRSFNSQQVEFRNTNLHILPTLEKGKIGLIKNFFSIFKLLIKERFDVIHTHFVFPTATWGITGKLFRTPVMVTSHGGDIQKDEDIGYGARLNKIVAAITWLTLKLINVHVVVSKSMVKDAIEAGSNPSKIRVIYNGIDLKKIQSIRRRTNILQRYGLTKNYLILLYLGRLHPKKCPDDLIKAFAKVVQRVPNAKLIFAGKGGERENLEKLASSLNVDDKVIFTGFVSEDEKWNLLKNCEIFLLPSIIEGHPISLIEAMACGKPVIATDSGPFSEIVRNGETGILVPVHSPDCLADGIIDLALDDERRREIGKKARENVENRFDINKIADDYLEIYALLNKKKRCT